MSRPSHRSADEAVSAKCKIDKNACKEMNGNAKARYGQH